MGGPKVSRPSHMFQLPNLLSINTEIVSSFTDISAGTKSTKRTKHFKNLNLLSPNYKCSSLLLHLKLDLVSYRFCRRQFGMFENSEPTVELALYAMLMIADFRILQLCSLKLAASISSKPIQLLLALNIHIDLGNDCSFVSPPPLPPCTSWLNTVAQLFD